MAEYVVSPIALVTRSGKAGGVVIHAGDGDDRQRLDIDGSPGGEVLLAWILTRSAPMDVFALAESLATEVGLGEGEAHAVVTELLTAHVLVEGAAAVALHSAAAPWYEHGWDDAAQFHRATFGQRFDPDTLADLDYADYYRWLASDPALTGPQPPAVKDAAGSPQVSGIQEVTSHPVSSVFQRSAPINRFDGPLLRRDQLLGVIGDGFGAQRSIGGLLGEHLLKVYPSGGARHPLEMHIIAKSVEGLAPGIYHVDVRSGGLRPLQRQEVEPLGIDAACFGKRGIVTADAVAIVGVRWLRHSWKYRYARSYRMVLLEVGHAVQAVHLAALAHGADAYHCPSINDSDIAAMLGLPDDCEEGPVYALGLGNGGTR